MLAPVSPRSVRVRAAQTATAEQLTRQLAGVVDANSNLQQQLLQFQLQHMADQRRIEQLEQPLCENRGGSAELMLDLPSRGARRQSVGPQRAQGGSPGGVFEAAARLAR
jgi:TolA-binding protein